MYAQVIDDCLDSNTHVHSHDGFKSISNLLYINKATFLEFSKLLLATTTFNGTERKNVTVTDGLDMLIHSHADLQAVVVFPCRNEPSVLPEVHERLRRKLLATLCLGRLQSTMEYLQPDNRFVTFVDASGNKLSNVVVTKCVPEHIAPHVQLDDLIKLKAFNHPLEEYNIWTYEASDKSWFLTAICHAVTGFIALVGHVGRLQDLWVTVDHAAILKAREQEAVNIREHTLYEKNYKNPLPQFVKEFEERRQREIQWPWTRWLQGQEVGRKPKPKTRKGKGHKTAVDCREADNTTITDQVAGGDVDYNELPLIEAEENGDTVEHGETQTIGGTDKTVTFVGAERDVVEAEAANDGATNKAETITTETKTKSKRKFRFGKQKPAAEVKTKKQSKPRKNKFKKQAGPITTVENDAEPDAYGKGVVQMKHLMAQHFVIAEAESDGKEGAVVVQEFVAAALPQFLHV